MGLILTILELSAATSMALSGAQHRVVSTDCLLGLKPALVSGNFSGSVDCEQDELAVQRVGEIRTEWTTFAIYSYRYSLAPVCPDCAIHGGHRIIFMEQGRYIGQYKPDLASVSIRDGNLVFDAYPDEPVVIKFTEDGPPDKLLVNGELISFFR